MRIKKGPLKKYDLLLRGGEIIDPAQGFHQTGDLAIKGGKIAVLGKEIPAGEAEKVLDMRGKIVSPGLIDIHTHAAPGFTWLGISPEETGIYNGNTLLCDAGSAGCANFDALRRMTVESSRTPMLCFLNLAQTGLVVLPEIRIPQDIDVEWSREVVEANRGVIRGLKIRAVQSLAEGVGLPAIETAKKLAGDLRLPLMMHIGEPRERVPGEKLDAFSRAAVALLEKGDILSHFLTWEAGGMIRRDGTIYPELEAAQRRGVILDACHGLNHFSFTVARHALANGLLPTVLSTDMASIVQPAAQSLAVFMSKFLNLGVSVDQVVAMATIDAARALGEDGKRGSLKEGLSADITVLELLSGEYEFADGNGRERLKGEMLLEPRMVFIAGQGMPAYSNYHIPPVF